jgi:hypothetical protein
MARAGAQCSVRGPLPSRGGEKTRSRG